MADLAEPTGDASIDELVNDPVFTDVVAALVDRRAGEIRAHHAEQLEAAGYTDAATFLRNLDT